MTLYVHQKNKNLLITHDGNVQLGVYFMTLEKFNSLSKVNYIETYWIPDTFNIRYKRLNYQKHLNSNRTL
jgi:hypothetical protein